MDDAKASVPPRRRARDGRVCRSRAAAQRADPHWAGAAWPEQREHSRDRQRRHRSQFRRGLLRLALGTGIRRLARRAYCVHTSFDFITIISKSYDFSYLTHGERFKSALASSGGPPTGSRATRSLLGARA